MMDVLKSCIPVVVGALVAIIPTLITKYLENKNQKEELIQKEKQELYLELISLFSKVLKYNSPDEINTLIDRINHISITVSIDVVKALNDYIDSWSIEGKEGQNKKYSELLKVIRVDLQVDKHINKKFPMIGLRDITIKK